MYFYKFDVGLIVDGKLVGWCYWIVGQLIFVGMLFEVFMVKNGIDVMLVEGVVNLFYVVLNVLVEFIIIQVGLFVLWWCVVGSLYMVYVVEVFIDEVVYVVGKDLYVFCCDLFVKELCMCVVLELVVQKVGWDLVKLLLKGCGCGIVVVEVFKSYVVQVVEVLVDVDGKVKVECVVCVVDCGIVINFDIVVVQMEGGIGFGFGVVMYSVIMLKDGQVKQCNFDGYYVLWMVEMLKVEVYIVLLVEVLIGVGELGVVLVGLVVVNVIFVVMGKWYYVLLFDLVDSVKV